MGGFLYSLWLLMWILLEPGASSVTMTTKDRKANVQRFEAKRKKKICWREHKVRHGKVFHQACEPGDLRRPTVCTCLKWVLYKHCLRDYTVGRGLQRLKDEVKTERMQ